MANKVKVTKEYEEETPKPHQDEPSIFDAIKGKGTARVFRLLDDGSTSLIGTFQIEEIENDIEQIPRRFGPGTYQFVLRREDGTYGGKHKVSFDPAAFPMPDGGDPGYQQPPAPSVDTIALMDKMQQANDKGFERAMGMINATMQPMIQMLTQQNSQKNHLSEVMDLFRAVKTELGSGDNSDKIISILKHGMDLGSMVNGGGEDQGIVAKLLSSETVQNLLQKIGEALRPAPGTPARVALPNPPQAPPVSIPKVEVEQVKTNGDKPPYYDSDFVKLYRDMVFGWAKNGLDPKFIANSVIIHIPEERELEAKTILNKPDFADFICLYDERLAPYKEWINRLRDEILKSLDEIAKESEAASA